MVAESGDLAGRGKRRFDHAAQEVRKAGNVLVKAAVRVAFISEGKAQPIPKALRVLLKADVI